MHHQPVSLGDVFQLRIALRDIKPAIWRCLRVPAATRLGVLHEVIQIAVGWTDSHLHDFLIGDIRFGVADDDVKEGMFLVDEDGAPLGAVAREGSTFIYRYDYGDDWEHEIKVERQTRGGDETIQCTGGERACPPEDCGGPSGHARLLEVLANKGHEEHAAMKRWVGRGFDPEKFDMAAVNKKLAALSGKLERHCR
jgi:hypothetical protein